MPSEQISFRLPKELLKLLDELASRDLRTRTNMIEFILMSWLREHEPNSFDKFGNIKLSPPEIMEKLQEIKQERLARQAAASQSEPE
jgi:metal-responsive CopG/Arc/MetJ family transcriptional regulator